MSENKFDYFTNNAFSTGILNSIYLSQDLNENYRMQPYYIEGYLLYSILNWKMNESNPLSFKYSVQISFTNQVEWKLEMGFQLDIVF